MPIPVSDAPVKVLIKPGRVDIEIESCQHGPDKVRVDQKLFLEKTAEISETELYSESIF